VFKDKRYTYRELDEITDRLANRLRKNGVTRGSVCGIIVKRSEDIVIAMLGIIKAGGCYVPIDPGYPDDRILYMLEDSGAVAVVGHSPLRERAAGFKGEWISLDGREYMQQSPCKPENINESSDLIYIIYTSGSTGKPKGVMIEHRNLVNLCKWQNLFHGVTANDVAAAYSGFSFDASIWEMTPFLTCGAELHIIADELRLSPDDLNAYFNKNGVSITNLPTQFCEQFMESAENHSLKTLVTGGDKLRAYKPSNFRLVNEYGPTEYTISATAFVVDKLYDNIPIGKPLANTWLYVVDKSGGPVPVGTPGELWISGAQIARGYLNRPELTREKFIENPFKTCELNSKLYKTGDLVRWTAEGNIEFLGRIDQQVKIRGYRIELGEIEQRLLKIESIKDAVVNDISDESGNKYLCAYLVAAAEAIDIDAVKKALLKELPEYMVPAYFTRLEAIPLTPNGKVDRRALPVPEIKAAAEYVEPSGETEIQLAELWREILGVKRAGAKDNFFDLGGHSLKASALQSKMQKIMNVKVSLADIFDNPTIEGLARHISGLAHSDIPAVVSAEKTAKFPLSASQMSMYFLARDEESSTSYNIPIVNTLRGKVNVKKLEEAIRAIIARHEAFRTSFAEDAQFGAIQSVEETVSFDLEYLEKDISAIMAESAGGGEKLSIQSFKGSARFDDFINETANEFISRFDLARAPLIRGALVKYAEGEYIFIIDAHHIIFDGTSAGIFFEELAALYEGAVLPPPGHQYRDYVAWEKLFKESEAYKKQRDYWLKKYEGELPALNLAADFARPAKQSFEGKKHYFTIDEELLGGVEKLAGRGGATLYHTLLAAWYVLLYRYTGQNDIIVGTPVAGRAHPDLSDIMGMFVNTVAIRECPRGEQSFSEFLSQVRATALEAMDNQYYEFIELAGKIAVKRDASRNPVFDSMFVLQNAGDVNFSGADFEMTPWKLQNKVSQVDLTLEAEIIGGKLEMLIEYCVKLFRPETIERMAAHYVNILKAAVSDAGIKLDKINILCEGEKKFLLCDLNDTALAVPFEKTVPRIFMETAEAYKNKTALVCAGEKYSYFELDKKTGSLAGLLRAKGAGRDKVIAVMVRRSADIMIAALAVMKAGGAYLPIDPDYPADRIAYMLKDSGAIMLLTQKSLLEKASGFEGEILDLGDKNLYSGPAEIELANRPDDLAYIIYTSGSTGQPKGVMIEQRSLVNLCAWHNHYHGVSHEDNAAAYSGFGFDASIWEMFPFITCGAELHIITDEIRLSPDDINNYFTKHDITITNFPTQFCEQFMEIADNKTLKTLVTGGDKLRSFRPRGYRLINEYGPTEYTVSATVFHVDGFYENIPIGKPLANTWIYILDRAGNLVPAGVPGELCISGAQMARGYLNRPGLTAEKFVKNPFATCEMNSTLYKTGDLVRYLADGNIEFLGRIDQQVKIRGYRIELGEIERQIIECENVKDAAVIDRSGPDGVKYLCAYIAGGASEAEIKARISQILPDYMIPAAFVFLDAIPLTANGKVDKKALPEPVIIDQAAGAEYEAPRNEREKILAGVWMEVLGARRVGINDNFFSLGGDSIKSIQAGARLKKFNFKLETRKLFATPTVAQLAPQLERIEETAAAGPVYGEVMLTPIQRWFFSQKLKNPSHWNHSNLLKAAKPVNEEFLKEALAALARHHDALRMVYGFNENNIRQYNRKIDEGPLFNLIIFNLEAGDNDKAVEEIHRKASRLQEGINLSEGPLLQAGLFKGDPANGVGDYVALIVHHLVVDGVSWNIIVEDLETAYKAIAAGNKPELPERTAPFMQWAEKLSQYAKSSAVSKEFPYWKKVDGTRIDPLPADVSDPESSVYADLIREEISVDAPATSALLEGCRKAYGLNVNEVLLSGLVLAIKEWSGGSVKKTAVTMEGHGREEVIGADITRTVGWFTSTYPVVLSAESGELADIIKINKEYMRHIPERGVAYEIIHELTPPELKGDWPEKLRPEIEFNHFGEIGIGNDVESGGFFNLADIHAGEDSGPDEALDFKLFITTIINNGALNISIGYNKFQYKGETAAKLAGCYAAALKNIADHCAGRDREYTPSDIADSALTLEEFNLIRSVYGDNIEKIYPLAPMQEGMIFLNMSAGKDSAAYFEQSNYEFTGEMDDALFAGNFSRMISKYDVFRTGFVIDGLERIRQVVLKKVETPIAFYDIRGLSPEEQKLEIERAAEEERKRGFDLSKAPLVRAAVLKLSDKRSAVIVSFMHIIVDGWSMGIIEKSLFADYCFIKSGKKIEEFESRPYSDFIQWLEAADKDESRRYWRGYLAGLDAPTVVPNKKRLKKSADRPNFADRNIVVPEEKVLQLQAIARKNNVTLGIVLQVMWGIMLMRYNNSNDAVFGVVVSGRGANVAGIDEMIGLFINTIPVRISANDKITFEELLKAVQQNALMSDKHSYLPLAEIQSQSSLRSELIDTFLTLQTFSDKSLELPEGFSLREESGFDQVSYDFSVVMAPAKEIAVRFNYNADVYEAAFVELISAHFEKLVDEVIRDANKPVDEYDLLPESEKNKILVEFNDTALEVPFDATIQDLFKEAAAGYPQKTALVFRDKKYTYRELDEITNRLAARLRKKGIKPGSVSAILINRSEDIIISMLGIIKAGGAYLPIDPSYPDDRIMYMLEDSGAIALLGHSALRGRVDGFKGEWIDLDARDYISESPAELENVNKSSDLLYVIYTSGSTGKPKGVMIEHRNLVNLCKWHNKFHGVTFADNAAAYSGFSFDASIWEMTPFITCGAELHIIADELRLSPEKLNDYFNENNITITNLPTQFCEQFMESAENRSLKTLVTGGDKLRTYKPSKFRLVNEYGPTEYTISATAFVVDKLYDNIPIGKPLANTWLYVLDRNGNPVPIGVPGELCISGAQMARGYLNRPELTAEKFIENPFKTCELNSMLYKTGDLVKWTTRGDIEFLGRIDQQVKIRGYRIELGEIEQQILKVENVKDAVVIDLADASGNRYLSAYIVSGAENFDVESVKKLIAKQLPEYMVPSYFTRLDQMPLTPNGKIDKKALPSPEIKSAESEYIEPSTPNEIKIAKVWKEVLGLEKIGVTDNFFLAGGNSIKAIAAVSKLSRHFDVSINEIFEYQVLVELAKNIKPRQDGLKLKLAAIMEESGEGGDISESPEFISEYERISREYSLKNKKYEAMDFSKGKNYKNILLTGGTGFLGVHLLREIIFSMDCGLTLIVRGKDNDDAAARVRAKLEYYFGGDVINSAEFEKVKIYRGDLSAENLGLSIEEYAALSESVDAVIHSAAIVKHYGHYEEFFSGNVVSTANLLKFASASKKKDFSYISTVSVASGTLDDREFAVFTEYDTDFGQKHDNYYLKTKFLAEKEVINARNAGLNASIYRVGNIVFNSDSGLYQENIEDNAFYNQIKSYLNIGAVPEALDEAEFSFVNHLSRAICLLFGRAGLDNEIFHIWNPETVKLSELLTDEALELNVERLELKKFIEHLYDNYDKKGMADYIGQIMTHMGWLDDSDKKEAYFSVLSDKTETILRRAGFEWPKLETEKLSKMITRAFGERIDFLRNISVFSSFSEAELIKIAGTARQKVFKNNEDLLWEGVYSNEFYVLMDGFIEICRNSIDGWTGTLMVAGPQSIVGEENFVLNKPSTITAESIMGDSLVLAFNFDRINGRIMKNPRAVSEMLKLMAEKIT
ncbi:MAG TPA: amino acid adenylation domain-containing protein, partial [Candidatus Wallbacteria bacterium]|nr:amino acid adenylation domain-containing protein [Candidatus Wallbacteria bacterium]